MTDAFPRSSDAVGVVVIGRNEGERLKDCLRSVLAVGPVVYVDSGSVDGSQDFAHSLGIDVVELAVPPNFTAARARNAGLEWLDATHPGLAYVQMVDGDCKLRDGWIAASRAVMEARPDLAVVFGRRRERYPDRSIYNALCDDEWDVPIGEVPACGGDALMRVAALHAVGGYDAAQIAGEEPDMTMRMRRLGWRVERIADEMTLHDADMTRFSQWWKRNKRSGHAFAELAYKYPGSRWPNWRRSCRSIVAWGAVLPVAIIVAATLAFVSTPWWTIAVAGGIGLYPWKMTAIAAAKRAAGLSPRIARATGAFTVLGKFAEVAGFLSFHRDRISRRRSRIIEYKGP